MSVPLSEAPLPKVVQALVLVTDMLASRARGDLTNPMAQAEVLAYQQIRARIAELVPEVLPEERALNFFDMD